MVVTLIDHRPNLALMTMDLRTRHFALTLQDAKD
jgi:hypothetical protein